MSEPVGNGPRRDVVPGNSITKREEKAAQEKIDNPEPAEKVIEGTVTTRKAPWWRRAGRSVFAEDAGSIGRYAMTDLIVPTIRNTIRELVVGVVDRALYGAKAGVARQGGPGMGLRGNVSSIRTRYDQMSEGSRVISREARARHDFDDVVFDNREEAIAVLEGLIMRIERYRVATVADLYNLCGVTGDFAAQKWGWTDLNTANVRQRYGGWLLDLPEPEPVRN
jgi:hypothetical protein